MNRETFNQIVEMLSPFVTSESSRRALVSSALFNSPTLNHLEYSGAAGQFAVHLVTTLQTYGGSTELIAVLETLKSQVGTDKQRQIDAIIQNIGSVTPSVAATTPANTKSASNEITRILFLSANPVNTGQLRLDVEMRTIDERLRATEYRDSFLLEKFPAIRVSDLQSLLLRFTPTIVHFSGHGNKQSEILLEDQTGKAQAVSPLALGNLFNLFKDNIRCVVLNSCYSHNQASAIASEIDCVIGMTQAIGDDSAIEFAASFYQALGYGRNVSMAFKLGCNAIDLSGLGEKDTPKIHIRDGVDATTLKFV